MPWRRSQRLNLPQLPHPIPDPDSVRRSALAASWQRDRRIAQRRLAWRWMAWFVSRYFLHILAVLALLSLAGWLMRHPTEVGPAEPATLPSSLGEVSTPTAVAAPAPPTAMAWPAPSLVPESTYTGLPAQELDALPLRPASQLNQLPAPVAQQAKPTDLATQAAVPSLKPENWLHSKEP